MESSKVQNYFEVQNIYVDQNKEGNYFLLETIPIKSMLDFVRLQTVFWYEGNGNNHYKIIVKLVRGDQVIIEDRSIFPLAVRKNKKKQTVTIKHGEQLLKNYKIGDQIQVYYNISEGNNESKLVIKSFEIHLIYLKKSLNKVQLIDEKARISIENASYVDNDHEIREILSPQLGENLISVDIELEWKDQGWGNQKGEVLARLRRGNSVINDYVSLFGIAKHELEKVNLIVQANQSFLKDYQANDYIDIGYIVGGGGGHSLRIRSLKLNFTYQQISLDQQDEAIFDKEIEQWIIDSESHKAIQIEQQEYQQIQQIKIKRQFQDQSILDNITCKICYSNIISRIFDCGHAVMCEGCFNENQLQQCPICRQNGYPRKIYFV